MRRLVWPTSILLRRTLWIISLDTRILTTNGRFLPATFLHDPHTLTTSLARDVHTTRKSP
jgi:hypothetical protein